MGQPSSIYHYPEVLEFSIPKSFRHTSGILEVVVMIQLRDTSGEKAEVEGQLNWNMEKRKRF